MAAAAHIGTDDWGHLWVNGESVWQLRETRGWDYDSDVVPVRLRAGCNELLLRVGNGGGDWGFSLRLTDAQGEALPSLRFAVTKDR
ncbi:MAG: hypothetical protein JSV65_12370 [Armatimonadota bacterium]|nr:MAG: hypothetical protein JSV65_12370 [Armatimonadota bacterium]